MKGNLLIVDDEVLLLKGMRLNLEGTADEIYTAENGFEALEILKQKKIHCIVCDINMPKMNGIEFIKEIRAQQNNVPFIFYTGHGNSDLLNEAAKYGAFDFLDKPNLIGLEEVVVRGLKSGTIQETESPDALEKEFKDLIDKLE